MGEQNVSQNNDERRLRAFTRALLQDIRALEKMLSTDLFESKVRRIGAEQEMFLVDSGMLPAPVSTKILDALQEPYLTTELALFNLEANLSPRVFGNTCLSEMHEELDKVVARAREGARMFDSEVLLIGSLPTLRKEDLGLENMTPMPRYYELNRVFREMRGDSFHVIIKGVDELEMSHDNVMLEACNTSFQVHFQVRPSEFAKLYNLAQAVTAPVLAAAVNSPVLLKHRLWQETRVALFQRSLETRSYADQARGQRPRVHFGDQWVKQSVLEIFREDIRRFRVMITGAVDEDPMAVLARGEIPRLSALRLHTGTIYRWNRACYGISDNGQPHLRIENRVLPSGPTTTDEIANAAFFFGLLAAYVEKHPQIEDHMSFDDARGNFFAAARHGLQAQFTWLGGQTFTAGELILEHLLPQAYEGLTIAGIAAADRDRYLGVIEERVRRRRTGAQWILESLSSLGKAQMTREMRYRSITAGALHRQISGAPVHEWALASAADDGEADWRESFRTVGQFMTTDLFTVRPGDIVDLAANVMDWEHIRHVPVEDDDGRLVGMVSHRALLNLIAQGDEPDDDEPVLISTIMSPTPVTVTPETGTLEAIRLMREHRVSALPVLDEGRLVGIITAGDFMAVAERLLERALGDS
ncbi:MAG: CBS domain-containing protein [Myxococcales bacterium]|nr:CBS domain-containing protein [Myxococcales bacterium]